MTNDIKKLFELPEILTLDGRQVTGELTDTPGFGCSTGCCDGSPATVQNPTD
jgi:hypothetical protein